LRLVNYSPEDWLIGLSSLVIVIFGYCLGLYFLYKSRKLKIKLLTYYSIATILVTTGWLSIVTDFSFVLFTSSSINKVFYVYLMWLPVPISAIIMYFIASELLIPDKKWYFLIPIIAFQLFLIIGTITNPLGSVVFIEPPLTGFIHKAGLDPSTISSLLGLVSMTFLLVFAGFGYLRKGVKSEGVIRKKFFFLAISIIFLVGFGIMDSLTGGFVLVFVRIGAMSSFIFAYLALRTEPERRKKRVLITEEEISFHMEKKICVVCKGNVSRVNYMCPKCNTLYCVNCSEALSNLENICWVCNEPIDETKPVRPYKEGETAADLKISKKDE